LPADDPDFSQGDWKDAELLSPPSDWGGGLPDGKLPQDVVGFDDAGRPGQWPMRYAIAHWAALIGPLPAGKYDIRCRTIDVNGIAQPQPRPFAKSGRNSIQRVPLTIVSSLMARRRRFVSFQPPTPTTETNPLQQVVREMLVQTSITRLRKCN
jgi:hypothetical protein